MKRCKRECASLVLSNICRRQSNIITTFRHPQDPNFRFEDFYRYLRARGFLIYPGKLSRANCFCIGTIGRINEQDVRDLVAAVGRYATLKPSYVSATM